MARSSAAIPSSRMRAGLPSCSSASACSIIGRTVSASLSLPLARLRDCTMRRSRLSRSASISSVSTVSASATGSIRPSTWVMSSSSKQRSTCTMASTSRMLARNWLPRPSPLEAPRTRPAMSTKEMRVGMISFDLRDSGKFLQARIGYRHFASIRLDGAERIVRRLRRRRPGQRIEKRRFAHVGQTNDAAFETHGFAVLSRNQNLLRLWGKGSMIVKPFSAAPCVANERPIPPKTWRKSERASRSVVRRPG